MISPTQLYTLGEASLLLRIERRALLRLLNKEKVAYISAGKGNGTRYIIKGKYLLPFVKDF